MKLNSRHLLIAASLLSSGVLLSQAPPVAKVIQDEEVTTQSEPVPKAKVVPEETPMAPVGPALKPKILPEDDEPITPPELNGPTKSPDPAAVMPEAEKPKLVEKEKEKEKPKPPEPPKDEAPRKVKAVKKEEVKEEALPPKEPAKLGIAISDKNDKNARTLFLSIPAPRGQIVDRNGVPLAQNKMAHFLGVQFPLIGDMPDVEVLKFARNLIPYIQKHTPDGWEIEDKTILEHYKNRRWLPLLASRPIPAEAQENAGKLVPQGIVVTPCYFRTYPNGVAACHILGQMGKTGGMTTNPIQNGDTIFPATEGRDGLERKFNAALTGTPGKINVVFNAKGEKVSEEIVDRPKPGNTVVTSIDLEMQKTAERVLRDHSRRGALVIMDVSTGDLLVFASNPEFDPNVFAYGVREADYKKLITDPDKPLLCRAKSEIYPPASTFKVVTALAALEAGHVDAGTYYECTSSMLIGDRYFKNWNRNGEGSMNVIDAIKRSCNTWFYAAAMATGSTPVTSMATRLGLGEGTGLCLPESIGVVPTPEWCKANKRAKIGGGDLANVAIGQGDVRVTPLQDCAMMAGIARGHSVPRARLVQQIQNLDGVITEFFPPEKKTELELRPESLRLVRAGMRAVVEESDGTGKAARNDYVKVAGKTGTGQWYVANGEWVYMTWFSGFIPANNPQYAFAAIYEGSKGEDQISGGKKVAPIIGEVFNEIYRRKKDRGDAMAGLVSTDKTDQVRKAKIADDDSDEDVPRAKAKPAPAAQPQPAAEAAPPKQEGGLRWLWKKMRGQ